MPERFRLPLGNMLEILPPAKLPPFSNEVGKRQASSGAKLNSASASRRLSAGKLPKMTENGCFRQMADSLRTEPGLQVHRFFEYY